METINESALNVHMALTPAAEQLLREMHRLAEKSVSPGGRALSIDTLHLALRFSYSDLMDLVRELEDHALVVFQPHDTLTRRTSRLGTVKLL